MVVIQVTRRPYYYAQMEEKEEIRIVNLNLDLVDQIRAQLPLLKHRRTDVYRLEQLGAK